MVAQFLGCAERYAGAYSYEHAYKTGKKYELAFWVFSSRYLLYRVIYFWLKLWMIFTDFIHAKKELLEIAEDCKKTLQLNHHTPVEKILTRLVRFSACNQCPILQLLKDKEVSDAMFSVRSYMSRAEFYLEHQHAQKIYTSRNPEKTLKTYPFYEDYVNLTRFEYHSFCAVSQKPVRKILFIGAGPLSMTSICLLMHNNNLEIDNLDMDDRAVITSQRVVEKLKLEEKITSMFGSAINLTNLQKYDAIILAALVGATKEEKTAVIKHLARIMKKEQLLLIRTTTNSRRFLYPSIEAADVPDLSILCEIERGSDMVNAAIIARKA